MEGSWSWILLFHDSPPLMVSQSQYRWGPHTAAICIQNPVGSHSGAIGCPYGSYDMVVDSGSECDSGVCFTVPVVTYTAPWLRKNIFPGWWFCPSWNIFREPTTYTFRVPSTLGYYLLARCGWWWWVAGLLCDGPCPMECDGFSFCNLRLRLQFSCNLNLPKTWLFWYAFPLKCPDFRILSPSCCLIF